MIFKFYEEEGRKKKANATEKSVAKKFGMRRHPVSGALDGFKGDMSSKDLLVDLKQTQNVTISVDSRDLMKIQQEADGAGKVPVLMLRFDNVKGIEKEWLVIPASVLED